MAPGTGGTATGGRDHYAVLEIAMTADTTSIAASYRRLARLKHPDKNRANPNATADFQALQEAYSVLKDEARRAEYDRQLMYKRGAAGMGSGRGPGKAAGMPQSSGRAYATAAATAAAATAAEMLRRKHQQQRQQQQQQQQQQRRHDHNEGGEGLHSYHKNDSGAPPMMNPRGPPPPRKSAMPWAAAVDGGDTDSTRGFFSNQDAGTGPGHGGRMGDGGTSAYANSHYSGRSYPPSPPNKPRWPKEPPAKDHALEKQIQQARKDIRAEDRTIRKQGRATKKVADVIAALWQAVHAIEDQMGLVVRKKAQLEAQLAVAQQWHNAYVAGAAVAIPTPPVLLPVTDDPAKIVERLEKNQRALAGLQHKLAQTNREIDGAMGQSRSMAAATQEAHERKAQKEVALGELCRRWRLHEFGTSGDDDANAADGWHGWCGWEEGDVEPDSDEDDDEDDAEDDGSKYDVAGSGVNEDLEVHGWSTGAAGTTGATTGDYWWYSSDDTKGSGSGSGDTVQAGEEGVSFTYNPSASEWGPSADTGISATKNGTNYSVGSEERSEGNKAAGSPAKSDREGSIFESQAETEKTTKANTTDVKDESEEEEAQATATEGLEDSYTTASFDYYPSAEQPPWSHGPAIPNCGQYDYFEEYGHYSTGFDQQADPVDYASYVQAGHGGDVINDADDSILFEEHAGGVPLDSDYQGKGKLGQTSGQKGRGHDTQDNVGQGSAGKTEEADRRTDSGSTSFTATGRRADQPQATITTTSTTSAEPTNASNNDIDEEEEEAEESSMAGWHDDDNSGEDDLLVPEADADEEDEDEDGFNVDLLGPLETARRGMGQHMPIYNNSSSSSSSNNMLAMSPAASPSPPRRAPRMARVRRAPGQSAVAAAISSLTGDADANSQSWRAGSEAVAEQNTMVDHDAREQAWRQAMWQGW
ncbi:hypothetical protein SPBR_05601 [Sporothrix brasiliensis 5110]|uniref:J domain-containing protein n=1 Tax=Sporothrix brasiliensis 5110 TaxID=1398154 RepID=A0A0C2FS92_9PEZI|nr:uncharacterized protein SPBR_05601 [Sporothrix brasiliensis 5110]KIH93893.1 hypothetical protein SPBR_05601 [Sporothrix brasiliensis 5110]